MTLKRRLAAIVVALGLAFGIASAQASTLPVNGGWQLDVASMLEAPTDGSPWTFTLSSYGVFSIVDCCVVTDTFMVTGAGMLITSTGLLTSYWTPDSSVDTDFWLNADYGKGQLVLGPGSYALTVADIADVGLPAGFYLRVDTIPAPAALPVFLVGLAGLTLVRRRARAA